MKKKMNLMVFILIIFASLSFGSELMNLTFSSTNGQVIVNLSFDSSPVWYLNANLGNVMKLSFTGKVSPKFSNITSWHGINVSSASTGATSVLTFDFPFVVSAFTLQNESNLTLKFLTLGLSQNLPLTGPASKISIDFSGGQGSNFNLAIKYLSRILGRNLIIDPSIANNPVNITLKDVTPAEAFYDIMISSPGVGYAILPDGTYYIAPTTMLMQNFGKLGTGTYNNFVSFYDLSTTNMSANDFKTLIENLFGQNKIIGSIGSYQIINATANEQKTIENLISFLKESESFKTIPWDDQSSVQDLENLINMMYPNLKMTYLKNFSMIVLNGSKSEIDKVSDVIAEYKKIIQNAGPKITVSFVVSKRNVQAFTQFATEFSGITIYGSPTSTSSDVIYLATGAKNRIYDFAKEVESVASTLVKVSPQVLHFNFVTISNSNAFADLSKVVSLMYPEVKMTYLSSFEEILIYSPDVQMLDDAVKFIKQRAYSSTSSSITSIASVKVQDYQTVKAIVESKGLTLLGPSKPSTSSTIVSIAIVGPDKSVNDLTSILITSGLIRQNVQSPSQTNQIIEVKEGLITVKVGEYSLRTVIQKVYGDLSKNVVFIYQNLPDVTMNLSNVSLDQFDQAVSASYGISFSGSTVVFVDKSTSGITKIYNASGNISQITSLAQFLGGNVYSDPNTGLVVVRGLTPYSAKELDKEIQTLLNPRKNVKIEAKILDITNNNNINDAFGASIVTPQLLFNNGLTLTFNLANPSNLISNLLNQILSSNATVTANLSQATGNATVLSAPTLMTQSGEQANITIGEQYPYLVTTVINSTTGQTSQQLQFLTTGIQLNILPVVLSNGQISLTITIEVSDADWGHAVNGVPALITRNASVKVVVSSGQMLIIGGLTQQNRSENVTKIPFLGDLPFIGQLFTSTTFQNSTDNLEILISASVVK